MAESIPPLRVRESDASPNVIPVFDMVFSGGTVTDLGAGVIRVTVDSGGGSGAATSNPYLTYGAAADLSAERVFTSGTGLAVASDATNFFVSLVTPVAVSSGGTGTTTHTAFGLLYGSGGSAMQALAAMVSGSLVVGSGTTVRPTILPGGAEGQQLISTGGVVGNLAWVNTLGGVAGAVYAATGNTYLVVTNAGDLTNEYVLLSGTGITVSSASNQFFVSTSAKVIRMPLALMTVQPDSANAFWKASTLPLLDMAYVGFLDNGEGVATYWGVVPFNLHPDPNWNLVFYSMVNEGTGGTAVVSTRASAVAHGESAAYTLLASAGAYLMQGTTALTVSAVSGGTFDTVVALASGDLVLVEVTRHGGNSGDTVGAQWNVLSVAADCNVL